MNGLLVLVLYIVVTSAICGAICSVLGPLGTLAGVICGPYFIFRFFVGK